MRSTTLLLISFALSLALPASLPAQRPSYPSPVLEPAIADGGGLIVEVLEVSERYPLAASVFFEEGRADLPRNYIGFLAPGKAKRFTDTTIPGSTLQIHDHILDIIGFRMRAHARATLVLAGCAARGEAPDLARVRANRVRGYLRTIWRIAPERMTVVASGLPVHPSDPDDPLGNAENARVDIGSNDSSITAPVVVDDRHPIPLPDALRFRMSNGIPDSLVADRRIEISRNGRPWHVMRRLGVAARLSPGYDWGKGSAEAALPTDDHPYVATLVVRDRAGRAYRSNPVTIPVVIVTPEVKIERRLIDTVREIYSFLFFPFDSSRITPADSAWMARLIHPVSTHLAPPVIEVIGHTDIIGSEPYNLALSEQRGRSVASALRANLGEGGYASISSRGVGAEQPLYPNDLPEGRFYNRTAQIRIAWPVP